MCQLGSSSAWDRQWIHRGCTMGPWTMHHRQPNNGHSIKSHIFERLGPYNYWLYLCYNDQVGRYDQWYHTSSGLSVSDRTISDRRSGLRVGGWLLLITHLRLHDPSPPTHHSHRWRCDLSWAKTIFTIFSSFLYSRFGRTVMDILLIKDRSWSLLPDAISGCRINYALWGRLFTSCCPLLCTTKNSAAFEAIIF